MRIESDRGAYRLVARREFVERIRDRSFLISTAITIVVLVGFIVGTSLLSNGTRFDLGVVGADARATAEQVVDAGKALGFDVRVHDFPNEQEAEAAVRGGSADAVLVGGSQVLVKSQPPEQLLAAIQAVSIRERARQALERAGLPPDRIDEALNVQPLPSGPWSPSTSAVGRAPWWRSSVCSRCTASCSPTGTGLPRGSWRRRRRAWSRCCWQRSGRRSCCGERSSGSGSLACASCC